MAALSVIHPSFVKRTLQSDFPLYPVKIDPNLGQFKRMDYGWETREDRYAVERLLGANAHQQGPVSDYIGNRISGALKKISEKEAPAYASAQEFKETLERDQRFLVRKQIRVFDFW